MDLRKLHANITDMGDEETSGFGFGGRLFLRAEDDTVFWVDIEGKHFMFQLSLCGPLPDCAATEQDQEVGGKSGAGDGMFDAVNKASRFGDAKVNFARFTTDPSLLDREDLVIKWGSK